jgi:hypothetical protein
MKAEYKEGPEARGKCNTTLGFQRGYSTTKRNQGETTTSWGVVSEADTHHEQKTEEAHQ